MHRCNLIEDYFLEETCGLLMRIPSALLGNWSPRGEWGILFEGGERRGAAAGGEGVVKAAGIGVSKEESLLCPLAGGSSLGCGGRGALAQPLQPPSDPLSSLSPCFRKAPLVFCWGD